MGKRPYTYWGTEDAANYSPDVTGQDDTRPRQGPEEVQEAVLHLVGAGRSSPRGRLDDPDGRPGPDPRPPKRYEALSKSFQLPRPNSFNEADMSDKPSIVRSKTPVMTQSQIEQLQLDYEGRIGSLLAVDDHVKKLVKTLKATGQLENTMIMFLSDNGWLQGEHRIPGDKFLPYEESIRIPLIIRGPGVKRNTIVNGQVGNIDFAPTLLDAAGAKAGRVMDGVSLLPTMRRPKNRPDRVLQLEAPHPLFAGPIPVNPWDRPYKGVRTDRYTYVFWTETGEEELYDLQADPNQLTNLANDPTYGSVKAGLAAKLALLEKCAGPSCQVKP